MAKGEGVNVANAYVQIIPSAQGVKQNITNAIVPDAAKAGTQGGDTLIATFMAKAKKLAALVSGLAIGKKLLDVGRAAVDSYADYEQLVGGIETLYGDMASTVMTNAQNAFQTAGLSANQYMEQVTGVSASLLQSLDGDTAAAAELANRAITDMSDNANKMGTDIVSLQNAYAGFAKGQFTMLDNLKLGYGGTKSEMERLLADAEAISGVHYDIESYADVVQAIGVIQDEMGITGTTAKEASTTISGSWGMLQGAWGNLLTSMAGGGDEIDVAVRNVFDSLGAWLQNLVPRVIETARGMFAVLPEVLKDALDVLPGIVSDALYDAFGIDINALLGETEGPIADMMERIKGHLEDLGPAIEGFQEMWGVLTDAFAEFAVVAGPIVEELLANLASAIVGLLPILVSVGTVLAELATGILSFITEAIVGLTDAWDSLDEDTQAAWDSIKNFVTSTFTSIKTSVISTAEALRSSVTSKFDAIKRGITDKVGAIKKAVTDKFGEIKKAITQPIEDAKDAVSDAIQSIKDAFNVTLSFPHIKLPHFRINGGEVPWGIGGKGSAPSIAIDWYAKGGFVDGATLIGVGEQGAEMVWPSYEPYLSKYAQAIAADMPAQDDLLGEVRSLRDDVRNLKVYLDTGALVGGISRQMDGSLGRRQLMAGRGVV